MATHADRLCAVSKGKRRRGRAVRGRRSVLRQVAAAMALTLAGCGYRPRVRLEGGSKGVDEWRVGLPF